ncbi:MAG: hypothetical protein EOO07_03190 [Chitinophagaceae bacterium]|nr:MAG: hypothetical protein EOO07_03190 [Chitinophagaceae bacterium]
MKKLLFTLFIILGSFVANAQTSGKKGTSTKSIKNQTVEIACGECKFKMKGKDCDLAIRIDGKSYFVDGKGVDDFGDAHAEHGFCNAIGKAKATGEIINGRFKVKSLELITETKKP